ncbi:MAG: hypothetical protein J6C91_04650 [Muribaculaceae bacterium]|nr:hypothetical protein [Muribaculaceae bacterium]
MPTLITLVLLADAAGSKTKGKDGSHAGAGGDLGEVCGLAHGAVGTGSEGFGTVSGQVFCMSGFVSLVILVDYLVDFLFFCVGHVGKLFFCYFTNGTNCPSTINMATPFGTGNNWCNGSTYPAKVDVLVVFLPFNKYFHFFTPALPYHLFVIQSTLVKLTAYIKKMKKYQK